MVVVTFTSSSLNYTIPCSHYTHFLYGDTSKLSSSSPLIPPVIHHRSRKPKPRNRNGILSIRSYMEDTNPISRFANQFIGSLPVIGLLARILSGEGGIGTDIIDFAEFRRRVGNRSDFHQSRAFYGFLDIRGKAGEPLNVLMCCWVAAIGAGLLKSEEILEGAARLRLSNDIEFEEQNFMSLMNAAKERRARMKVSNPAIPMEVRVEKALEAIYVCCYGKGPIKDEDAKLLCVMLMAVFPSVKQPEIDRIVKERKMKVEEGNDEMNVSEEKAIPMSKEALKQQMEVLKFLRQNNQT